jgi:uncharacterized membrane protein YhaH (DUF805 family)
MSMGEAIRTVLGKYADFDGRAGLPDLWWWLLFVTLVASALNLFAVVPIGDGNLGSLLSGLWGIAVLLPTLAVGMRRLRDAGHGWGYLLFLLVPIGGLVILAVLWSQPAVAASTQLDARGATAQVPPSAT